MKWNILLGSLVLGLGLSTQSFGMDLLDRMLGMGYSGCCDTASCCETNCVDPGPSCGCETGCDACVPCAKKCRKTPLLDLLRGCGKKKSCCDTGCDSCVVDPGCGCEVVDPGCGCETACEPACGCEDPCAGLCARRRSAVAHCWTFCEVAAGRRAAVTTVVTAAWRTPAVAAKWWIPVVAAKRPASRLVAVPPKCAARSAAAFPCSIGSSEAVAARRAAAASPLVAAKSLIRAVVASPPVVASRAVVSPWTTSRLPPNRRKLRKMKWDRLPWSIPPRFCPRSVVSFKPTWSAKLAG